MQTPFVHFGDTFIAYLVVLAELLFVGILFIYFAERGKVKSKTYNFISRHSLLLAFLASLAATCGSLFYSDIAGYEPCKFCWFQRIFMYPQVFILGIALIRKDLAIWRYSLTLSIIGALIAVNHVILQWTGTSIIPCSAVGQSVSCSKVFVTHFGYMTIPLMALSAFAVMIIAMIFLREREKYQVSENSTPSAYVKITEQVIIND